MAEQKNRIKATLSVSLVMALLIALFSLLAGPPSVADTGPIKPLEQTERPLTAQQQQAQRLALASAPVQRYAEGARAEVFTILPFRTPFVPAYDACRDGSCYQVDIFDFDQAATITAIVHVAGYQVLDAWLTPASHPLITPALYQRAVEIIQSDPDVVAALGYEPTVAQTRLMDADHAETRCAAGRLCAGATFMTDSGAVWVLVDLHEERIETLWWEEKPYDMRSNQIDPKPEVAPEDCNTTIHVARDGWTLDYRTTPTDGLEVTSITHNIGGVDRPVATRLKLLEWHARYPTGSGYRDYTGCGGGAGGGFPIYPAGSTQIRDLYDQANEYIGFAVVQDFRMSNWTFDCNYRYDQIFEFYTDGRYRVKAGAYGRGCGNNQLSEATYRPVIRMDVAVLGDGNDTFSIWNGSQWVNQTTEGWWLQSGPVTAEGYRYRVMDQSGFGYFVEPGQGQFGDYGTGDNAYTYLTLHRASEGDADFGALPDTGCCNTNHRQGPHYWVDGENVFNQNIVLWYVPASETITTWAVNNGYGERQYCWTDSASRTWPCFAGPMFTPNLIAVCSPVDFDCSLIIDTNDITAVASQWNCVQGEPSACYQEQFDLDDDSDIDIADVLISASRWGCGLGDACYQP
jgi:hypothetical protein